MKGKITSLRNCYGYILGLMFLFLIQSCLTFNGVLNENQIVEKTILNRTNDSQPIAEGNLNITIEEVKDAYLCVNNQRLENLRLLKPRLSYDYKNKNSEWFYNILNSAHNAWEFYASDVNINTKSSLKFPVKKERCRQFKENWLYLMNARLKWFTVKEDLTSFNEKATTFVRPSGEVDNIESFITIEEGSLSSRCYLYIKPPTDLKFCTLNNYKVTKIFYDDTSASTFLELKLKSEVAVVYLYLKSKKFNSIVSMIPKGTRISTGVSQLPIENKKTAREIVMNEQVKVKKNK